MKSTTISGRVKKLKLARLSGENIANFKIDNQSVMLYIPRPVIDKGDHIIVAGKYKNGLFVSHAMYNLTQNVSVGELFNQLFTFFLLGFLCTFGGGIALYVGLSMEGLVLAALFPAVFLCMGIVCLYVGFSRVRQKSLVDNAARKFMWTNKGKV